MVGMAVKAQRSKIRTIIFWFAILVVIGTAVVAWAYYMSPKTQQILVSQPSVSKAEVDGTQKTPQQKAAYSVPPERPRQLIIDSLGVNANILPMGALKSGALDAPKTAWDVGWYSASALPGSGYGALLIDGHVNDSIDRPGVFAAIGTLKNGDVLKIQRGDGVEFSYSTKLVEQKPINQVDMNKLLRPITEGKEGVNLITCGGTYNKQLKTYDDRILVYSERIN
jgi:LPXTG-site transpeptidase (sortase) family protein